MNTQTARLELLAPITGVVVPIETVPDPVFAKKMVGEGISVDPVSGTLVAPCDGQVVLVHASMHAVTVRHAGGAEILMHIGLDTVAMSGEGFKALVKVGDKVSSGDPLVEFDLDLVSRKAKSLLTQVVVANSDQLQSFQPGSGFVTAGKDVLATLTLRGDESAEDAAADGQAESNEILIRNPLGLHARPTAVLVGLTKNYASQIVLQRGDKEANAKSVIAIMSMAVLKGDRIRVIATGPDALKAVTELEEAILGGLGEELEEITETAPRRAEPEKAVVVEPTPVTPEPRRGDENLLVGVSASPGLGVGQVVQIRPKSFAITETASNPADEQQKLRSAIEHSMMSLGSLQKKLAADADADKAAIFAAHQELLTDPDLMALATTAMNNGKSAAFAWQQAYTTFADQLAGLSNEVLAGRANDVRDIGQRVLAELTGQSSEQPELAEGTILIAEDLTPSDTAALDRTKVAGFATVNGGASSHVAILARSLDIPAIAGIEARALSLAEGTRVILDGTKGTLRLGVSAEEVDRVRARQIKIAERREIELSHAHEPAVTIDGHTITVAANIGGLKDAQEALTKGAEGVGLLRSEFLFLGRTTAPTEDEQAKIYHDIAQVMPGKPLVIRTLDVGGDKPLPYLPIAHEDNPFLGLRGVRVGLDRPEILRTQTRAILRAVDAGAQIHVMFPMIATLSDYLRAKEIFEDERAKMGISQVPLGVMVEVPSVAIMADQFAREVDFFSVGTNDLTQYTLAMDRGHPMLAAQVDAVNPAVLALIGRAAEAAHKYDRWIGVCGGIASDPQAIPLLAGLGVDELSCSIPAIPGVKAQVRSYTMEQCKDLAASSLRKDTPADVRDLVPLDED